MYVCGYMCVYIYIHQTKWRVGEAQLYGGGGGGGGGGAFRSSSRPRAALATPGLREHRCPLGPRRQGHRGVREATNHNDWNFPSRFALTTYIELPSLVLYHVSKNGIHQGGKRNGSVETFTFQPPVNLGHSGWKEGSRPSMRTGKRRPGDAWLPVQGTWLPPRGHLVQIFLFQVISAQ